MSLLGIHPNLHYFISRSDALFGEEGLRVIQQLAGGERFSGGQTGPEGALRAQSPGNIRPWPGAMVLSEPARVLLIDGGISAEAELTAPLTNGGHTVARAHSGEGALSLLDQQAYDLVMLEAQLTGMSGFETCRALRARSDVPLIFLSHSADLADRLMAFDLGADDYVRRPVEPLELERRVRAVLRRARHATGRVVLNGPASLQLDLLRHEARVRGEPVAVTPREFELLRLLLERRGEVMNSDAISLAIWGYETMGSRNFVEAHVSRLRSKLRSSGAGSVIETIRGVGYVVP